MDDKAKDKNIATATKRTYLDDDVHRQQVDFIKGRMNLFDTRMYRKLNLYDEHMGDATLSQVFYPHFDYGSFVSDFYETETSVQRLIEETDEKLQPKTKKALEEKKEYIKKFKKENEKKYLAARSFIHPYALVKLAGAYGNPTTVSKFLTYDQYNTRKFYEIDGDDTFSGNYSKTPTTTMLIKWGNESERGKTPYSFQDFVFCKWWSKIENNRLITLRRYAAPVTDNIEFADYVVNETTKSDGGYNVTANNGGKKIKKTYSGRASTNPWTPLATAVTYFGEETGNQLSELLSFSAKYNWEPIKAEDNPIDISSKQNDAGSQLINSDLNLSSSGLGTIAKFMGFLGEASGGNVINLEAAPQDQPPDPYSDGPYMNRILGPVNVIMDTIRRKRGLEFKHEGLKIKFDYIARPIAGINSKAVLLDLMSNILILTYSSGSWFGGMWRYRADAPAVYPWKYGDAMNKLYRGEIFGKNGAVMTLTKHVYSDGKSYLASFLPDAAKFISNMFKGAIDAVYDMFTGDDKRKKKAAMEFESALSSNTSKAIQKVIAAKAIKGATVPYIQHQRALLTGEPVGDWHLTIGNPLNPIAMIGNLVVTNVRFTWSNELGPDDFPIGFTAEIELSHGLGRDRDAIESMFNRGFGRIYTLSSEFRSSADGETKVDAYTGNVNTKNGRVIYDEVRNTYFGGGTRFIAKTQHTALRNTGSIYNGDTENYKSLKPTDSLKSQHQVSSYYVNAWQMGMNL